MKAKKLLKNIEKNIDDAIDKGLSTVKKTEAGKMYSTAKGEKGTDVAKRLKYGAHIGGLSALGGAYGIATLKEGNNKKQERVLQ